MTVLMPLADITATATLVLAGITLVLATATIALVLVTRAGTAQARKDAWAELRLLERQISALSAAPRGRDRDGAGPR